MLSALTVDQLITSLATRLDGPRAQHESFALELRLKDLGRSYQLLLSNGVLIHREAGPDDRALESIGLSCTLTKGELVQVLTNQTRVEGLEHVGDPKLLARLMSYIVDPNPSFAIVMP